ncbi:MAG: alpha/beta fold hydrolase [Acidimicrobiaceae bacterium]|nr:alpha/beta fold hydrolase [Acidimicrobiaceae bacterium]
MTRRKRVTSPAGWTGAQWRENYLLASGVWARILGRYVDPVDNFFRAGGVAQQVPELLEALRDEANLPLTRPLFDVEPTLVGSLGLLSGAPVGDVVPFRLEGERPPLFLISGSGGVALQFVPLVQELGENQPVIALQSRAAQQRRLPEYSLKSQARRLTQRIEEVAPTGDLVLGGHSMGGLVALEVAHELTRRGRRVSHLFIIDTRPEVRMTGARGSGVVPTNRPLRFPRPVIPIALAAAVAGLVRPRGGRLYQAQFVLGQMRRRFIAPMPAFAGPTHLFVTRHDPEHTEQGWRHRGGNPLTVESIPGSHNSCLRPPHVSDLGSRIRAILDS